MLSRVFSFKKRSFCTPPRAYPVNERFLRPLFFLALALSLFFAADSIGLEPAETILYPPDKSVMIGGGYLYLVAEVKEYAPQRWRIALNDDPVQPSKVVDSIEDKKAKMVHYGFQLRFGRNTISIVREGAKGQDSQSKREVFFYSVLGDDKIIPPGFARLPLHQTGRDKKCRGCHQMDPQKSDVLPPKPEASSCYPCHKQITAFQQVHGPASLWACTQCHDPRSTPARYEVPPIVRDLCYRCHQDAKEYFFKNKYQHGPTSTGMCTICHNPHGTNNPFWLKKSPWYLCTTCHFEKATGRHVIAWGPSGQTHPMRGKPDPTRPQMEFACNSCHNPHAAPGAKLWNFDAEGRSALCPNCHPQQAF